MKDEQITGKPYRFVFLTGALNWRPGTSSINCIPPKLAKARGNRVLVGTMYLRCANATDILVMQRTVILSLTLVKSFSHREELHGKMTNSEKMISLLL